jgi:hypothetical protein
MDSIEEVVRNGSQKISSDIKKSIYDWICAIIIIAVVAASLDIIGIIDFTGENAGQQIADFVMQWIPYFMATILLNNTLYKKGVFVGKRTDRYKNNSKVYGELVNSLTGQQIRDLDNFCQKYNDDALKTIQTNILKKEGIAYEDFEKGCELSFKNPLKILTEEQLVKIGFNKLQIKAIKQAKNVKLKGLTVNSLLSSMNIKDPTNIGKNEIELARKRNITSIIGYIASTLLMSLLAIKNIADWGWSGLILVLFKVLYTFARSYMSYFQGYNDMTVDLVNHIARKTDILKMFINYKPEPEIIVEENKVTEIVENIKENNSNIAI